MENINIVLNDSNQALIERISDKVGKKFYGNTIDVESLLNLLADLEDNRDELEEDVDHWRDEYNDLHEDMEENYKPVPPDYGVYDRDFV